MLAGEVSGLEVFRLSWHLVLSLERESAGDFSNANKVKVEGEPRAKDGPGRDRRAPGYTMDSRVGPKFLQQRTRSR